MDQKKTRNRSLIKASRKFAKVNYLFCTVSEVITYKELQQQPPDVENVNV